MGILVIINSVGFFILAVCFGVVITAGQLFGISDEGPLMVIAGPLITIVDLTYRLVFGDRDWFRAESGGMLFFLPVWQFGLFWIVLGVVYMLK